MPPKVKTKFIESVHCLGRGHCHVCRNRSEGVQWRSVIAIAFEVPGNKRDFDCPFGVAWIEQTRPTAERPKPTMGKIARFLEAMIKAGKVPEETRLERISACLKCDFFRKDQNGNQWCGACGCKFSAEDRTLANLAAYKEGWRRRKGLPKWGCRHPRRFDAAGNPTGIGWKV